MERKDKMYFAQSFCVWGVDEDKAGDGVKGLWNYWLISTDEHSDSDSREQSH